MTILFINPITVVGVMLILFLPRGLLLRCVGAVAVIWFFYSVFSIRVPDDGPGAGIGMAIFTVWATIFLAALGVRAAFELWHHRRRSLAQADSNAMAVIDAVALSIVGVGLSAYGFIVLGRALQGTTHDLQFHIVVALASLVGLIGSQKCRPGLLRVFLSFFTATFGLLSLWGVMIFPGLVRESALTLAHGAPYCISRLEVRPVTSSSDLTFFGMGKARYGRHAVLLVDAPTGSVAYHWSYRSRAFVTDESNPVAPGNVACIPRFNFLDTLDQHKGEFGVTITDRRLTVPLTFYPRLLGRMLIIAAAPPAFGPDPSLASRALGTDVDFGYARWLRDGFRDKVNDGRLAPTVYGLRSRYLDHGGIVYMYVEPDGHVAVWIECPFPSVPDGRCQHRFSRGNDLYTFAHSPDLLPEWRTMENRLVALIAGFESPR